MTEVPAAAPESEPQPSPYIARYDTEDLPDTSDVPAKNAEFIALITELLPSLLAGKSPEQITEDDLLKWLYITPMRYIEVDGGIGHETIKSLRSKLQDSALDQTEIDFIEECLASLELPWGFDEFGHAHQTRRCWENALDVCLTQAGCREPVVAYARSLGGYFGLGASIGKAVFLEYIAPDNPNVIELVAKMEKIRKEFADLRDYRRRLELLVSFRSDMVQVLTSLLEQSNAQKSHDPSAL